jgi:hypothetical protein
MERRYGAGYDSKNAPIDGDAVYATGGIKAQGWWDHYYFHSLFWYFVQMHFTYFELWRYAMFNGLIILTQVQPQRGSSSKSPSGNTLCHRMEQDIAAEMMQQWMRQNEEYNLQMNEYYRQWEEQWDAIVAQQHDVLQVKLIVNNQLLENWTLYLYY